MKIYEISYFILSLVIIGIENNKLIFLISLFCLFDVLLSFKK